MNAPATQRRSIVALTALGTLAWLASFQEPAKLNEPPGTADGVARGRAMVVCAKGLLACLDEGQQALARATLDNPERRTWAFGPVRREGIRLDQINSDQFVLLEALLDTTLSDAGMDAWHQVRELESVLRKMESTPDRVAAHRDPNLYWLRVYGTPGPAEHWSWRFEGHHFALHVTCMPNQVPSVTPFFLGASPFLSSELGPGYELRSSVNVFGELNRMLKQLVEYLDEDVAKKTMPALSEAEPQERPRDIRMGPGRPGLPAPSGIDVAELPPASARHVRWLLRAYTDLLEPDLCQFDLEGAESVHFSRWGGTDLAATRTWSIRTETFALELATTDGPNHVHALLRDISRDFGGE